jgi:hypothetical protein
MAGRWRSVPADTLLSVNGILHWLSLDKLTPGEMWTLCVEVFLCAWIIVVDLIHFWHWLSERSATWNQYRETAERLDKLEPSEQAALRSLYLQNKQPADGIALNLQTRLSPPIIERDFIGWKINGDYREVLRQWARVKRSGRIAARSSSGNS